jgi:predicted nucleic acid-binding protein
MSPASIPVNLKDPSNSLPDILFVDTSVLLSGLSPPHINLQYTIEAQALLRLVRNAALQGNAFAFTSTHVVEECFFKIIQGYLVQEAIRQRLGAGNWHRVYKGQPSLLNTYVPSIRAFYQTLISIPINVVDPSELTKTSSSSPNIVDMMQDWIARAYVLPADALHLSEAERLGIYDIAAFDLDFTRAQGFTVYTYSNSIK